VVFSFRHKWGVFEETVGLTGIPEFAGYEAGDYMLQETSVQMFPQAFQVFHVVHFPKLFISSECPPPCELLPLAEPQHRR